MDKEYIRKIDDLGRIVIPLEIRKTLKLDNSNHVLLSSDENKITISKYSYLEDNYKYIKDLCNLFVEVYKEEICIKTNNEIIYSNITKEQNIYAQEIFSNTIKEGIIIINSKEYREEYYKISKLLSKLIELYLNNS